MSTSQTAQVVNFHAISDSDRATMAGLREVFAGVDVTFEPSNRSLFDGIMEHTAPADGVTTEAGLVGGISGWWVIPAKAAPGKAVLYLHGGAFVIGSAQAYRNLVGHIAQRAGVAAFIPDYRLAPESMFPAAIEDAKSVFHGLIQAEFKEIAVVGDSAGGGLSVSLLQAIAAEADVVRPVGGVLLSPWADLGLESESMATRATADPFLTKEKLSAAAQTYLGVVDPHNPLASPLYGSFAGLPPILIHVGEDEVLLDDARRLRVRAEAAGAHAELHVWEGMVHVFPASVGALQAADAAMEGISAFLRQRLGA